MSDKVIINKAALQRIIDQATPAPDSDFIERVKGHIRNIAEELEYISPAAIEHRYRSGTYQHSGAYKIRAVSNNDIPVHLTLKKRDELAHILCMIADLNDIIDEPSETEGVTHE